MVSIANGGDNDEPNEFKVLFPGSEDHAHLQGFFGWNDIPNTERTPRHGYFVEYGSTFASVPEPPTITIFAIGLVILEFMHRRRAIS